MPVLINNESDYLGPSQACVNPLFVSGASLPAGETRPRDGAGEDRGRGDKSAAAPSAVPPRRRTRRRRAPGIVLRAEGGDAAPEGRRSLNPVVEGGHPAGAAEDIKAAAPPPDDLPPAVRSTTVTVKSKPKTVTLSDCLSCSGCVTSAEAVLMSRHSADALREEAARAAAGEIGEGGGSGARRDLVFTLSPASLADLWRHLYEEEGGGGEDDKAASAQDEGKTALPTPPTRQMFLRDIADFLGDELGATLVIDGSVPQRASLEEAAAEFRRRYEDDAKLGSGGKGAGLPDTTPPSIALSSTRTRFVEKRPGDGEEEEMDVTVVEHPPGLVLEEDLATGPGGLPSADLTRIVARQSSLPVLTSSCPGFVCLAEKTAPAAVPLLSSAKSPMAAAGSMIKAASEGGSNKASEGRSSEAPYHVAVMPCHDKKLEAGRDDLAWEGGTMSRLLWGSSDAEGSEKGADGLENGGMVREVDLVITTGKLLGLLGEAAGAGDDGERVKPVVVRSYLDKRRRSRKGGGEVGSSGGRPTLVSIDGDEVGGGGGQANDIDPSAEARTGVHGSGSYADYVFRSAALGLFGCDLSDSGPLPWRGASQGRALPAPQAAGDGDGLIRRRRRRGATGGEASSTDIRELTLYAHADGTHSCDGSSSPSSVPVLRFAAAYGFKNVQSVLRGLSSPGTTAGGEGRRYDYVEVMACPSGCANGGGQVGPGGRKETPRGARERARAAASAVPVVRPPGAVGLSSEGSGGRSLLLGCSQVPEMEPFGRKARGLLHTRFHVVPKLELTSGAAAGVAVSDTNW